MLRTPPKRDAAVKPTLEALPSPTGKSPRLGELRHKANLSSKKKKIHHLLLSVITFSIFHLDFVWIVSAVRGKAKLSSPAAKQTDKGKEPADKRSRNADESAVEGSAVAISSPLSSPVLRSPLKGELLPLACNVNFCGYPHL